MTREDAYSLLTEYTKNENLIKHAIAVEAAMRAYARKFGEDEEKWRIVGLLHDFDYEIHPTAEEHPLKGADILRERGYSEEIVRAVLSHANHMELSRDTTMEKALYAVDELTGFIIAVALVRPNKSLLEVKPKSVRKKMKDKAFARAVNRDDLVNSAELLGVDLSEHIGFVIEAMQGIAPELGLEGTSTSS
jgi:putative nucleotidyltransferase with HDIG domain